MDMSQDDYEARVARVTAGTADDEDRRLVKQYEGEGYECRSSNTGTSSPETTSSDADDKSSPPSPAPTTAAHSRKRKTAGGTAGSTDGPGRNAEYSETELL